MKRLLLILCMLMLPLQGSWAAGLSYTQHGMFGNHSERCAHSLKSASVGNESQSDEQGTPTPHGDCAFCHLGHCNITNSEVSPSALSAVSPHATEPGEPNFSAFSIPPDRPKWPLHA